MYSDRYYELRSRYENIRDVGEDSLQEALSIAIRSSMESETKPKYQIDPTALAIYFVIIIVSSTVENEIAQILLSFGFLFSLFWAYKSFRESERRRESERVLGQKLDALFRRDRLERIRARPGRQASSARRRPPKASTDLGE